MIILDVEQGSQEWFDARAGVLSASNFKKVLSPTGKVSAQRKVLMNQLISEKIIGEKTSTHQSMSMQRGTDLEPEARDYYEFITDNQVKQVGLVYMNESKDVSCSPDGLMDKKGLEIKCPEAHTQVQYLFDHKLPTEYIPQIQGSMLVAGLREWDFLSYHPDLPHLLITVRADYEYQAKLKHAIKTFNDDLLTKMSKIKCKN